MVALFTSLVFVVLFRELKPFHDTSTDTLAYVCGYFTVLCAVALVLLDAEGKQADSDWASGIAGMLFTGICFLVVLVVYLQRMSYAVAPFEPSDASAGAAKAAAAPAVGSDPYVSASGDSAGGDRGGGGWQWRRWRQRQRR